MCFYHESYYTYTQCTVYGIVNSKIEKYSIHSRWFTKYKDSKVHMYTNVKSSINYPQKIQKSFKSVEGNLLY